LHVQIFAWEYNPDHQAYTTKLDTNLRTKEDFRFAADHVKDQGRYLYQMYIDSSLVGSFKSDKVF
jgi:hypothetical protein